MSAVRRDVLIVDDERDICALIAHLVQGEGLSPTIVHDGDTALRKIRPDWPDVLLVDLKLPDMDGLEVMRRAKALDQNLPVILLAAFGEVRAAVEAIKAGAHDYLPKPFDHTEVVRVVLRALGERELNRKLKNPSSELHPAGLREILGPSDAVSRLIADVNLVAKSNFSVLILGETGSGKEVVTQAIHQASHRSAQPFVPVDCGAIPETLLEDELFGHEKGAFTGAHFRQAGKFETARGGTLFLDEISNMPLGSQAKLLRALQEKAVFRIGGARPVSVDVRVLAASNQDLQALAETNAFRCDLYFRLNEFTIRIPALRERREDIPYLARRFLDLTNVELHKNVGAFSESAMEALLLYHWPGNVRELRSTVRRAVLFAEGVVADKHLDIPRVSANPMRRIGAALVAGTQVSLGNLPLREVVRRNAIQVEREAIAQALRRTGGNKSKAARLLQIDYKTIHSKVKEYGIAVNGKEEHG